LHVSFYIYIYVYETSRVNLGGGGGCAGGGVLLMAVPAMSWCGEVSLRSQHIIIITVAGILL